MIASAIGAHTLGALHRVFWNRQSQIELQNLNRRDADELVGHSMAAFLTGRTVPSDFATRVAQAARGNPGRIVEMCIRAADPAYHADDHHLRFGALVVDSITGFMP